MNKHALSQCVFSKRGMIMASTTANEATTDTSSEGQVTPPQSPFLPSTTPAKQGRSLALKYGSLFFLCTQNALTILIASYTRSRPGDMFLATTAVILTELCKMLVSLAIIFYQEGWSLFNLLRHLKIQIIDQPMDCIKISVPSIVYTLQNNLLFIAVSNLDAAVFQVTYQLKILTAALFSVIMLDKKLSKVQWVSLVLLFAGVAAVQLQAHADSSTTTEKASVVKKPIVGLFAVVVSCLMSGFAGVYFEKILKGTKPSLWVRNVQLGTLGVVVGTVAMAINDGNQVMDKGFLFGYDWVVWSVVVLQAFGGIMVAMVVKYADNILKGFATSAGIVISSIASIYLFDFHLSGQFVAGASLVIAAVYLYSKYEPTKVISSSTVAVDR